MKEAEFVLIMQQWSVYCTDTGVFSGYL